MKKEAELNADSDKKVKEEIEKLNQADSQIFQTEKQLKEYGEKIPAEKKVPIETALAELKVAHGEKDQAKIETSMADLNKAWEAASAELYKAMNEQQQAQGGQQNTTGSENQEKADKKDGEKEVTDVDFEEVK